ncbi:MAG: hypothetical protein HY289_06995 [Planctomycetes bacterium]|nr:hypothetical protein [Planctomycetota bacterium]
MGLFDWLKSKTPTSAPTHNPWKLGERVLAKKVDSYFYPGVVRELNEHGCMVVFDDGEAAWVHHAHVLTQDIKIGSRVFCRAKNAPVFAPGAVTQLKGETVRVRYDMGERGMHVLYDDGDQRVVQENMLMPLAIEEGEQLFIRPKSEPQRLYTPATVLRVHGETMDVEFDDATHENNTRVSRARFWRCPVGIPSFNFEEGDRVLALDCDECVYPAEIVTIEDDHRIVVQYLDGPERMLTPELIRRFDVKAGMKVECRFSGGPNFFPGTLNKVDGERIHVKYDDGDDEWTSIRLFRIPPKRPM